MADFGQVQTEAVSIVDQLMNRGRPAPVQMPNIYGDPPRGAPSGSMPPANAGIPNPSALTAPEQKQPNWWDDEEPAGAQAAAPAAPAAQPAAQPAIKPIQHTQFEVQDFSLFNEQFKPADIGPLIDGLVAEGRINPMRAVNQADLDALIAGDMSRLPTVLNAAVAAGIREAITATTKLVSNSMGKALAPVFDRYGQHTEGTAAKTAVAADYSTAAERTLAGMYREKYLQKNPRASAAQTAAAVKQAMEALGSELVTARQPPSKQAQAIDWASELN